MSATLFLLDYKLQGPKVIYLSGNLFGATTRLQALFLFAASGFHILYRLIIIYLTAYYILIIYYCYPGSLIGVV